MKMQAVKNLFLLFSLLSLFTVNAHSQNLVKNYEKEWKKAEAFVEKGLPKSALAEVKKIYDLAKKEKQDAQIIKSLVYITSLQNENREDNPVFSMAEVEKEITLSKEPVTAILKSLLAEMYWNYFQQNRWKLYNRTKTQNFNKTEVRIVAYRDANGAFVRLEDVLLVRGIGDRIQENIYKQELDDSRETGTIFQG